MADRVRLEITETAAVVTLDSPPLNIFDLRMRDELIEAVAAVRELDHIAAMILAAAGPHFSAGADLSEFGSAASIFEGRRIRWDRDPWGPLWDVPVPTIAALHGVTVGSGLEMALLCDIRVAEPTAKLALPETKLAMLPAAGGTQSLTKAIGPAGAVPFIATADTIGGAEALELGIISFVADDPDQWALDQATKLAGYDRAAVTAIKRALRAATDGPLDRGLALERRLAQAVAGA